MSYKLIRYNDGYDIKELATNLDLRFYDFQDDRKFDWCFKFLLKNRILRLSVKKCGIFDDKCFLTLKHILYIQKDYEFRFIIMDVCNRDDFLNNFLIRYCKSNMQHYSNIGVYRGKYFDFLAKNIGNHEMDNKWYEILCEYYSCSDDSYERIL